MANAMLTPVLLTRPADTNIYAVGDGIAALTVSAVLQELASFSASAGGTAVLDKIRVVTSQKACQAGIRIHFYTAAISAAGIIEDNAVFAQLTADKLLHQGYLDLDAFNTEDTTSTYASTELRSIGMLLTSEAVTNKVYFQFEIKTGAFTPDNAQTFHTTAWVVQ